MDQYARPQHLVSIGVERRLNLYITGEGGPTVVLTAGLAGLTLDWGLVQPRVARFARVVSFDHAGLGFSDPGPHPRDSDAIVTDLRAALGAAGLAPPYVLAGHSAGGVHMRRFAQRHPEEVAGLVLIDSITDDFQVRVGDLDLPQDRRLWRRLQAMSEAGTLVEGAPEFREHVRVPQPGLSPAVNAAMRAMRTRPSYYATLISESEALSRLGETRQTRPFPPDLPLTVLAAGRSKQSPFLQKAGRPEAWAAMQSELARLSTRGQCRTLDGGHNLPLERPREVAAAIREISEVAT